MPKWLDAITPGFLKSTEKKIEEQQEKVSTLEEKLAEEREKLSDLQGNPATAVIATDPDIMPSPAVQPTPSAFAPPPSTTPATVMGGKRRRTRRGGKKHRGKSRRSRA